MQGPIHSKGQGRSGPKRKTGCLTCRRRKVRCDETRPVCANCIRLRLDCVYPVPKANSFSSLGATAATNLQPASQHGSPSSSQQSYLDADRTGIVRSGPHEVSLDSSATYSEEYGSWTVPIHQMAPYGVPIPSNSFAPFDGFDLSDTFPGSNDDTPFAPVDFAHRVHSGAVSEPLIDTPLDVTNTSMGSLDIERHTTLLDHFTRHVDPTVLVQPTDTEWRQTRQSISNMANGSSCLMSAVLSTSTLYLHCTRQEDSATEAFEYYKSSSRDSSSILDSPVANEGQLRCAFATLFLLVYVEILGQTAQLKDRPWPLRHLRSFHHRVHQYQHQIRTWTGFVKSLVTWTSLLQVKAEAMSEDPALQHCSSVLSSNVRGSTLFDPTRAASSSESSARGQSASSSDESAYRFDNDSKSDPPNISSLAYETLNQPGYEFFLACQVLTSRISSIHRQSQSSTSDTAQASLETVREGQRISADLHTLWSNRPSTINLLTASGGTLEDIIQPELARMTILNLRVYVAHFFAQFIALHRRAFATYPASREVQMAVTRILGLAREILNDAVTHGHGHGRGSQALSPSSSSTHSSVHEPGAQQSSETAAGGSSSGGGGGSNAHIPSLPPMMLWPLFLAATECSPSDRAWVVRLLHSVDARSCPTANGIVPLLQNLLRKQDESGARVDCSVVRREMLHSELSVFF